MTMIDPATQKAFTLIDPTPAYDQPEPPFAATITPMDVADKLRVDLEGQKTINDGLRTTINKHRDSVRDLYTRLNDMIADNNGDEESTITFGELSEILSDVFNSELVFTKEYEVQVQHTLYSTFKITAASEDDARSIAEDIGICREPDFDMDGETTEIDSWSIDEIRVDYVREA